MKIDPLHLDFLFKKLKFTLEMLIFAIILLIIGFVAGYLFNISNHTSLVNSFQKETKYVKEACIINDYCYRDNSAVRVKLIIELLKAIDKYLPVYFSDGPYNKVDFIALALTESGNFDQYLVGAAGEKGIYQIMQNMCNAMGVKKNYFDINVNTELAMFVLREKFNQHKDYRNALIAYNGFIINARGQLVEKYWRRFSKIRKDIEISLSGE